MFRRSHSPPASTPVPTTAADAVKEYVLKTERTKLVQLADNEADWLTVGNFLQGTQVFGATGSGKTTGSGRYMALAFLEQNWGGLVLTAKRQDAEQWTEWANLCGRAKDIIELKPGGEACFNFLQYEVSKAPENSSPTYDVVNLFINAMGGDSEGGEDGKYWQDALRQLLHNAIDLALVAGVEVTTERLANIVRTAPRSDTEADSPTWQHDSDCWKLLDLADQRTLPERQRRDFDECAAYWMHEFPSLADKTRSSIVSTFTSKATALLRNPLRELFASSPGLLQVTPELTLQGKIILVNLPIKIFGETGRFAQRIVKIVWQRAMERRKVVPGSPPAFLWSDESQYFVTPEDSLFQQTARSSLVATVYLTQNLPNYLASIGGRDSRAHVESLLGNLQTKIFHANGDPKTNEWAASLIGSDFLSRPTRSMTSGGDHAQDKDSSKFSIGETELMAHVVKPREFTTLKKAGGLDGVTEAIVFQGGRRWSDTGENYIRAAFSQG